MATSADDAEAPSVSEVGSHAGTLDVTGGVGLGVEDLERADVPDSSRRYGGPMVHQYKYVIVLLVVSIAVLVAALVTSTKSLQQSNEALALATSVENQMLTLIDDSSESDVNADTVEPPEAVETITTTPDPTPNPTAPPTPLPSSQPTSAAPTKPHPLNPKWYQTTHADYQFFHEKYGDVNHDWETSNQLCSKQNRFLCSYETYCPNGQGGEPYGGGPPKLHNWASIKETQWAPFVDPKPYKDPKGYAWVQVGIMSNEDGGNNENGYVQCWKYDDWYGGEGLDIVEKWEEEHRVWILCCEGVEDEATGEGGDV